MAEKAFLRCIVPAIAFSGHGLSQLFVFDKLSELNACIMAALIGVDDRIGVQLISMITEQLMDRFQYKINFQVVADLVGQDLFGESIHDR